MNHRDHAILLLRVLAIWFAGSGLASIGSSVIQAVSLLGVQSGPDYDQFNWYALIWLISPIIELAIAASLWHFAPRNSLKMLPSRSDAKEERIANP